MLQIIVGALACLLVIAGILLNKVWDPKTSKVCIIVAICLIPFVLSGFISGFTKSVFFNAIRTFVIEKAIDLKNSVDGCVITCTYLKDEIEKQQDELKEQQGVVAEQQNEIEKQQSVLRDVQEDIIKTQADVANIDTITKEIMTKINSTPQTVEVFTEKDENIRFKKYVSRGDFAIVFFLKNIPAERSINFNKWDKYATSYEAILLGANIFVYKGSSSFTYSNNPDQSVHYSIAYDINYQSKEKLRGFDDIVIIDENPNDAAYTIDYK